MGFVNSIKRDIARHRQKAAVLAVLLAVMLFMCVRAVSQMRPQSAAAATEIVSADPSATSATSANDTAEAEDRIRLSKELWRRLLEKRGMDVSIAFKFDSSSYPLDPSRAVVQQIPVEPLDPSPVQIKPDDTEINRRQLELRIRQMSNELRVQSTTLGSGKPWAIVNQQLVSLGDMVKTFEVTAIRAREVEFTKEGVTVVVKMPDDLRGQ